MREPRRQLLLELYQALRAAAPATRAAAAAACARGWGLLLELEVSAVAEAAERLAVRLAHRLELRGAPLCARIGPLQGDGRCGAALQAALAGAPLLAGRDGRALLAATLDPPADPEHDPGALVDSETCARIALAGGDPGGGPVADAARLLALAGDLIAPLPPAAPAAGPPCVLVAALRLDATRVLPWRDDTRAVPN